MKRANWMSDEGWAHCCAAEQRVTLANPTYAHRLWWCMLGAVLFVQCASCLYSGVSQEGVVAAMGCALVFTWVSISTLHSRETRTDRLWMLLGAVGIVTGSWLWHLGVSALATRAFPESSWLVGAGLTWFITWFAAAQILLGCPLVWLFIFVVSAGGLFFESLTNVRVLAVVAVSPIPLVAYFSICNALDYRRRAGAQGKSSVLTTS